MYLIALCDDETAELDKTEQILHNYEKEHPNAAIKIERFETAAKLIDRIRAKKYTPDLIILDIYMPHETGIDAAKTLREMGNKSRIIFLTTSKEHALDAFRVEAAQYLVKPLSENMLFPILNRFLGETEELRKKYVLLRIDGRIRRVLVKRIVFCEAQGKKQCLHFSDGTFCILNITMTELYETLSSYPEFVRVGIAYIVNLEHVESVSRQELQMDNQKTIYPPRGSYQSLREKYFTYYCEDTP